MNTCQIATFGRCTVAEGQREESQTIVYCDITLILTNLHYLHTQTNALTIEITCL
jgi:hypothetical protein